MATETAKTDGQEVVPDKPTKRAELVAGSRAQVASVNADEVLVAAPKALYGFSISTPEAAPRLISDTGAGEPAAPVRVRNPVRSIDCVYAAWSGTPGSVVRGCGTAKAEPLAVKNAGPAALRNLSLKHGRRSRCRTQPNW